MYEGASRAARTLKQERHVGNPVSAHVSPHPLLPLPFAVSLAYRITERQLTCDPTGHISLNKTGTRYLTATSQSSSHSSPSNLICLLNPIQPPTNFILPTHLANSLAASFPSAGNMLNTANFSLFMMTAACIASLILLQICGASAMCM
jgi:hypothetical protein